MRRFLLLPVLVSLVLCGCGPAGTGPTSEGQRYLAETEPQAPQGVVELKAALTSETPPSGDLVVIGRVGGGQHEAFDPDQATFLLRDMDLEIKSHDHGTDDNCKFCQAQKAQELLSMALVRVLDDQGQPVAETAPRLLGLEKDQVVVARGTGQVDASGTFIFDSRELYLRPAE